MRKPILSVLFALSLAVLSASAGDAPGKVAPAGKASGAEAPGGKPGMRAYICDSALSTITFKAIHPFATVHGVSHAPACTVWVNPDTTEFLVHASARARSFKTGNGLRDSHAMKAVEADKFPLVTFTSKTVKPKDGKVGPYSLAGDLTFHGETRPIEAAAKPEIKDGKAVVRGSFPVSFKEYKVTPPSLMGAKARDTLTLSFDLVFDLSGAK